MFGTKCDLTVFFVIVVSYVEVTHSYLNYSLESPDLCSHATKKRISLSSEEKSGLIVTQKRLNNHNLEWTLNSICKFQVSVKENRPYKTHRKGIIAVIQKMSFRRDPDTWECIDYVQFTSRDRYASKKLCGTSSASLAMQPNSLDGTVDDSFMAENTFVDVNGEIDVYIFVAKEPLLSHENTDISIVFTSYQRCESGKLGVDQACDSNLNICIYSGFFRDGYYNCPYMNCMDEDGCLPLDQDPTVRKDHIGNKVLIGSVTSLLVTFSIFICCIYICRKYGKLCWAEEFARPSIIIASENHSVNLDDINIHPQTGEDLSVSPSAPVDDKDLPPSYDSLFPIPPNRQLPTSTNRE